MLTMKEQKNLNTDTDFLKLIASVTMFLDHFGKIFAREIILLQIVGRIAFPLFAYCLATGAVYTRDIKKYMIRLGLFAIITQPIYILAFLPNLDNSLYTYVHYKNILFTLLTGLAAIYGMRKRNWYIFAVAIIIGLFGSIDYGIYGVALIVFFYAFRDDMYKSLYIVVLLISTQFFTGKTIDLFGFQLGMNGFGLLALPLVYFNTNTGIKANKYFFYIFYPAHFLVFLLAQII